MTERVSTTDVRRRIGDMLNRVARRHEEFVIERKGQPLAALVPVERLEQMRRFARRHALQSLDQQKGSSLSDEQAMNLALAAQGWLRGQARTRRRWQFVGRCPDKTSVFSVTSVADSGRLSASIGG